jgi:hypothetical protein
MKYVSRYPASRLHITHYKTNLLEGRFWVFIEYVE